MKSFIDAIKVNKVRNLLTPFLTISDHPDGFLHKKNVPKYSRRFLKWFMSELVHYKFSGFFVTVNGEGKEVNACVEVA